MNFKISGTPAKGGHLRHGCFARRVSRRLPLIALAFYLAGPASAEDSNFMTMEAALDFKLNQATEACESCKQDKEDGDLKRVAELKSAVKVLTDYLDKDARPTFTVKAGFDGDQTSRDATIKGVEESFKINAGAAIRRGVYPAQLALVFESQARSQDGKFEEELSTMRASIDYYLPCKLLSRKSGCVGSRQKPPLVWSDLAADVQKGFDVEIFGFVERFTDKLMSIDQRWEAGGGTKIEWSWWPALKSSKAGEATGPLAGKVGELKMLYELCLESDNDPEASKEWGDIEKTMTSIAVGKQGISPRECEAAVRQALNIMKRHAARIEIGLSSAVMAEFENPGALTLRNTEDAFTPDSDTRFRLSNRFSLTWRPLEQVVLDLKYFLKLPIDKPVTVGPVLLGDGADGPRYALTDEEKDVRQEASIDLTYTLPGKKNKIEFSFDWYNDSGAPFALIPDPDDDDRQQLIQARSQHRVYKMSLVHEF